MFEEEFFGVFAAIIAADTEAWFRVFEQLLGRPIEDDEIEPRNAAYRQAGRAMTAVDYLNARAWIGMWSRRSAEWWSRFDVLVTPTVGAPPPRLGWFTEAGPDAEGQRILSFIPYTAQFNMTGQPAVSLPLHWSADGLPVGVQLVAAYGREACLCGSPPSWRRPRRGLAGGRPSRRSGDGKGHTRAATAAGFCEAVVLGAGEPARGELSQEGDPLPRYARCTSVAIASSCSARRDPRDPTGSGSTRTTRSITGSADKLKTL